MSNLKTKNGRIKAIKELEKKTLQLIVNVVDGLPGLALLRIDKFSVEISLKETDKTSRYFNMAAFASEVKIYTKANSFYENESPTINFGSSGQFSPDYKAPYFRTITAAKILENWDAVTNIVEVQCNEYRKLSKEIEEINQ